MGEVGPGSGFESMYEGVPPWDIGEPQPALRAAEEAGEIRGDVLDAGCGTGELSLYLASRGHRVLGLDGAPSAVRKARQKAQERGSSAEFMVGDALRLGALGRVFGAAVDCGLFHVFDDAERAEYERGLRAVLAPEATLHLMCFSDEEPGEGGPRRVSQREIRQTFGRGWRVESISPARFKSHMHPDGARAWLARLRRVKE
jgi:SAM-dependent methyltransferase